jgi:hypothetical protein
MITAFDDYDRPAGDPLGYNAKLAQSLRLYPLGRPLTIETNFTEVLTSASALWSRWCAGFDAPPAIFRVNVQGAPARLPLNPSMPHGQKHLVSIVHSPENFAICDVKEPFAYAVITRDVAMDREYFQYHFLEPLAYLMLDAMHFAPVHAACVAWEDKAVVLCGDSGAGKTSIAYACAREGWTYLSDDATHVIRGRSAPWVAGRPYRIRFRESARRIFPELDRFQPKRRPNGKLDIEVCTDDLSLSISTEKPARHVVFLDRREPGTPATVSAWPTSDAARHLHSLVAYGDETIRNEQARTLSGLLALPLSRITYGEPASAERALRNLVNSVV